MTITFTAVKPLEGTEVDSDDDGDEHPEEDQKAALLQQVGLTGLPDQFGDLPHGPVDRQLADLEEDDKAEDEAQRTDDEAQAEEHLSTHTVKLDSRPA